MTRGRWHTQGRCHLQAFLHHVHGRLQVGSLHQSIQVDGTNFKQVEAILVCGCHQVQPRRHNMLAPVFRRITGPTLPAMGSCRTRLRAVTNVVESGMGNAARAALLSAAPFASCSRIDRSSRQSRQCLLHAKSAEFVSWHRRRTLSDQRC